jgi:thiol-disulfide isomerase/thioredoxin
MKIQALLALATLGLLSPLSPVLHGQSGVLASSPADELQVLVTRIQSKLQRGQRTEVELQAELAAFDALIAKHGSKKTDDVAQILYMRAMLHAQVFGDGAKAEEFFKKIESNFPGTRTATLVQQERANIQRMAKAKETQEKLVGQPAPELNFTWVSAGNFKKLSDLKGKVVVLDFWATWCGPCVATFPQIAELVTHYKDMDVAIVGVTSIQGSIMGLQPPQIDTKGNPAKEMDLMREYIKAKAMTWTVAFSEQEVFNPDYGITGIPHMAIIAPDGKIRHTGLHPGMPHEEKVRMIDAILKEFGKPVLAVSANK